MIEWVHAGTYIAVSMQAVFMAVDELKFHRERSLGAWEAFGHPIDSLAFAVPLSIAAYFAPSPHTIALYTLTALFSCMIITKDELIHANSCAPAEHWIHACLFVLHPIVLGTVGVLWAYQEGAVLRVTLPVLVLVFGLFQLFYWSNRNATRSRQ